MAYSLTVTHLCVGQGLSVLIDLDYEYPMGTQKKFVGLMDLGSIGDRNYCGGACDIILQAIATNENTLNYVHISHMDEDHYNQFQLLRTRSKTSITIEHLVVGGRGSDSRNDLRDKLVGAFTGYSLNDIYIHLITGKHRVRNPYGVIDVAPYTANVSIQIDAQNDKRIFFRINTLLYQADIHPMVYNEIKGSPSLWINTGSSLVLVAIVDENDVPLWSFLFTGDATKYTMKIMMEKGELVFDNEPKHITVSHHGSKCHVADNEENTDFTTLNNFLATYKPSRAIVSACCTNRKGWTHPHYETMRCYEAAVGVETENHMVTCFQTHPVNKTLKIKLVKIINTTKSIHGTVVLTDAEDGEEFKGEDKYTQEASHLSWHYPPISNVH